MYRASQPISQPNREPAGLSQRTSQPASQPKRDLACPEPESHSGPDALAILIHRARAGKPQSRVCWVSYVPGFLPGRIAESLSQPVGLSDIEDSLSMLFFGFICGVITRGRGEGIWRWNERSDQCWRGGVLSYGMVLS